MSAVPTGSHAPVGGTGVPGGAKLSKVGLKHGSNSRQPANIHHHNQVNNYADASGMFHGTHHNGPGRQSGTNSLS